MAEYEFFMAFSTLGDVEACTVYEKYASALESLLFLWGELRAYGYHCSNNSKHVVALLGLLLKLGSPPAEKFLAGLHADLSREQVVCADSCWP